MREKDGLAIDKILEYAEKEFAVPEPEKLYADMHMYVDVKVDKKRENGGVLARFVLFLSGINGGIPPFYIKYGQLRLTEIRARAEGRNIAG